MEAWGKSEVFSLEAGLGRNEGSWLHVEAWWLDVDSQRQVQDRCEKC